MLGKPTVIHVVTHKGRGYEFAEGNPTRFHGTAPFTVEDGQLVKGGEYSFTAAFADALLELAEKDDSITAVTAAMAKGTGLHDFQQRFPTRFFDVGIAEQHALAFAAGQARTGCRPVAAIYSTFMQRAVDQVIHDIAIPGLPVIMALDRSGLVGDDGETHQGVYDIALFKSVPGLTILAPGSREEMHGALAYARLLNGPVIIRYPKAAALQVPELAGTWKRGRGVLLSEGRRRHLLVTTGGLFPQAQEALRLLAQAGIDCDLYNLRFIKPLDEEYLARLFSAYERVYSLEDASLAGGIGESLGSVVLRWEPGSSFAAYGLPDRFYTQGSRDELLEMFQLDAQGICDRVLAAADPRLTIYKQEA